MINEVTSDEIDTYSLYTTLEGIYMNFNNFSFYWNKQLLQIKWSASLI